MDLIDRLFNKKTKIEAEGSELILKNAQGDHVIIPKNLREDVQKMLDEKCDTCIDKIVETLPSMSNYAEDGTLITT